MRTKRIIAFILVPLIAFACNLPSGTPEQQGSDFDVVSTYAAQTVKVSLNQAQATTTATTQAEVQPTAQSGQGSVQATPLMTCKIQFCGGQNTHPRQQTPYFLSSIACWIASALILSELKKR